MRIESATRTQHVTLELLDADGFTRDVRVTADFGTFRGEATVYLDRYAIDDVIRALGALDETRRGRAQLESMNPDELVLAIATLDAAGHLQLDASLSQHEYAGGRRFVLHLAGAFELDAASLPAIIAGLRRLADGAIDAS